MTDRSLTGFKASVSFVWSRAFSEYWPSRRRRRRGTPGISITGSAAWGSWFSSERHVEVVLGGRGKGGPILQPIEPIKTPIHYTVEGNEMIRAASRLLWCIRGGMKVLEWVDVLGAVAWYLDYLCVAEIDIFAALCVFFLCSFVWRGSLTSQMSVLHPWILFFSWMYFYRKRLRFFYPVTLFGI